MILQLKKIVLFIIVMCLYANVMQAFPIENYSVTLEQPDGSTVSCFLSGDEYYNWVHDAQGYTLIRDASNGWIVYALLEDDQLVSSGYVVGSIDPASVGIQPYMLISDTKRTQLRQAFNATMATSEERSPRSTEAYTPRTGTLNNIVIYIRFSDEPEFTRQKNTIETLFNNPVRGSSLYSYFRDISDNNFFIHSTFYPNNNGPTILSFQDTLPRGYYQPYDSVTNPMGYDGDNSNERRDREHNLLRYALESLRLQLETALSDVQLDQNGDGKIDNICFVIKGSPGAWSSLLWPHRWSLYSSPSLYINGRRAYDYNLILENHLFTAGNGLQSVLVHETYHTLGAPDLYRYAGSFDPVGKWDVMCSNTVPPQSSSAYISNKYGHFVPDIPTIVSSGNYTVYNIWDRTSGHNIAYKIASPNSDSEFFIVEYRKKTGEIYESQIPGSGIVIYRVIPSLEGNAGGPPDEVYVFRPGAANSMANGTINNAYFSSQIGRTVFNDQSNPPCFLSYDSSGGIDIWGISASGADSMTFNVTFSAYQITASATGGGGISPSGVVSVIPGDNQTFTFIADVGYSIDQVLIDGINNPTAVAAGYYTFSNVNATHSIAVSFACFKSLPLSEGFNASTFPPSCWKIESSTYHQWSAIPNGTNPDCYPYEGARMLVYNAWDYPANRSGRLISPKVIINNHNTTFSFKMYRDNWGSYANSTDRVNFYLSNTISTDGLTPVATYFRNRDVAPIEVADDWYEYSLNLITNAMSSAYLIIEGVSDYGNNIYLDDIRLFENNSSDIDPLATSLATTDILVYPNPATDRLTVRATDCQHVDVVDILGRVVIQKDLSSQLFDINISNLQAGIYLLRLRTKTGISTQKFVKTDLTLPF